MVRSFQDAVLLSPAESFPSLALLSFGLNIRLVFYLKLHITPAFDCLFHDLHVQILQARAVQVLPVVALGPESNTELFQHSDTHSSTYRGSLLVSDPALDFHYS